MWRALIGCTVAALVASAPAHAEWREYAYPSMGFAVAFPSAPAVDDAKYEAAPGVTVDARTYSLRGSGAVYRVTIADLSATSLDQDDAIDSAVKALSAAGDVTVNVRARVNRVFGRQLSIATADGGHSSVALFYFRKRLYRIEGTVLGSSSDAASGEAIRFQQSLRFTNGPSALSFDNIFGFFR